MGLWLILAAALLAACFAVGWWGAGIILHPPKMSSMSVFPEQFGLRYEKVSFKTEDGLTLRGWYLPSPTGDDRTLIMSHGWGDNKGELLAWTYFLNSAGGFNLLYFDYRSHGESEGKITTLGYQELVDFRAAAEYLKRHRPRGWLRLGVFGHSMGAAVAAMALPDHAQIKAAMLESPFTDYRQVARRWAWNNLHIPYFPFMIFVLWLLPWRVGRKDVGTYSPARFIHLISPRPILLIGGAEDRLMPPEGVRDLFDRALEPKELWIVPAASHGKCRQAAGAEYDRRVIDFFLKHL